MLTSMKLASLGTVARPMESQRRDHVVAQLGVLRRRSQHLVLVPERLQGGHLGQPIDVERLAHLVDRLAQLVGAEAVADAQAAQAVDLGEGAQHDDVAVRRLQLAACPASRPRRRTRCTPRRAPRARPAGTARTQIGDRRGRQVGAGRVVRVADDEHLGARRDGRRHGGQVVGLVA